MARARGAGRRPPRAGGGGGPGGILALSDAAAGRRFATHYAASLKYVPDRRIWFEYGDGVWHDVDEPTLLQRVFALVPILQSAGMAVTATRELLAVPKARNVLDAAKGLMSRRSSEFDNEPLLLNTVNGTVDLETGRLLPHNQQDALTQLAGCPYVPGSPPPQRWLQFLREIFPREEDPSKPDEELIDYLQRAIGYTLTGLMQEDVFWVLYGPTARNGKSTMLNILRELLGSYYVQTAFQTFSIRRNSEHTEALARLKGARMIAASESEVGEKLAVAKIKQFTGRDPITARYMYEGSFSFKPTGKLWLATNHTPTVDGSDSGLQARMQIVPFRVSFKGREDHGLEGALLDELESIFVWCVEGAEKWLKSGKRLHEAPSTVKQETEEYMRDNDPLGQFLAERAVGTPGSRLQSKDLYNAYELWAMDYGFRAMTHRSFSSAMKERREVKSMMLDGRRFYVDLAIASSK